MATTLDALIAQVEANTQVETGAIAMIKDLAQQVADCKNHPGGSDDALQALSDKMKASADQLAAALVANTPAQPPVELPPSS